MPSTTRAPIPTTTRNAPNDVNSVVRAAVNAPAVAGPATNTGPAPKTAPAAAITPIAMIAGRGAGTRVPIRMASAGSTASHARSSNNAAAPLTTAIAASDGLPVESHRHRLHPASNASAGDKASPFHETPRHQKVALEAMLIIASAIEKTGTPAARSHAPNAMIAAAPAAAARSRSAVRRPRATASDSRAVAVLAVGA